MQLKKPIYIRYTGTYYMEITIKRYLNYSSKSKGVYVSEITIMDYPEINPKTEGVVCFEIDTIVSGNWGRTLNNYN